MLISDHLKTIIKGVERSLAVMRATSRHIDLLVPLFDSYRQFYGQEGSLQGAKRFLRERIRRKDSVILIALDSSGTAYGFVQLYLSFSSVSMKRLWILNDLFVLEAVRKKGVAQALIARSLHLAKETRSKGLVLETAAGNNAAKSLYEKLGWNKDNEFDRYFLNIEAE